MVSALAAAALICVASLLVGEAAARVLGLRRWRATSGATGLALLVVVALVAVKLPGDGTTGAVTLGVLTLAAAALALGGGLPRPSWHVVGLTAVAAVAAGLPYISNWRFGFLGMSFNNDLFNHIPWTRYIADPTALGGVEPPPEYPLGAHSLSASLTSGLGIEPAAAFSGLLIALPVLIAWAALELLDGLRPAFRALAALMVATAYAVSAFVVQANFKEVLLTLFLLAMVAAAREAARHDGNRPLGRGVEIGILGAAIVVSFNYAGLAWPGLAAVGWAGLTIMSGLATTAGPAATRARAAVRPLARALPIVFAAVVTGLVLIAADVARIAEAVQGFGSSPAGTGLLPTDNLGHLVGPVSKREIFGFWPREDFRYGIGGGLINDAMSALAVLVAVYGAIWWTLRRDLAVPAAAVAAVAIAVRLSQTESAYTASKALAPAGALVMLLSVRALLGRPPRVPIPGMRFAAGAAAVLFIGGALWSSYLVLRGGKVGPLDHRGQLRQLQQATDGESTLFLGNDDFARAMLHEVPLLLRPLSRPEKAVAYDGPFDFDDPTHAELDSVRFVITPRTAYRSEPPPNFHRIGETAQFELWERRGPTPARLILAEGKEPGVVLDCKTPAGRKLAANTGWARVWPVAPITAEVPPEVRLVPTGERGGAAIPLGRGEWQLSLQYVAHQEVTVTIDGRQRSLPANLDRSGPFWAIGTLASSRPTVEELRFEVADSPLDADSHYGVFLGVAAVRVDAPRETVPLAEACGRYVDWYTLGRARPDAR